jgi:hypothetical protein
VTDPETTLGVVNTPGANPDWWVEQHSCDATFSAIPRPAQTHPESMHINGVMPHEGYLILRLRSYPAWRIVLNGRTLGQLVRRDDDLIAVPVPQGSINLTVDWTTTSDILAGRWITELALLLLTALWLLERRDKTGQ